MANLNEIAYRSILIPEELDALVNVWNKSVSAPFTITSNILRPHLDGDPNFDHEGLIGAYLADSELIGFVIVKRWQVPQHEMGQSDENQWVRDAKMGIGAMGVLPDYQHQGIGRSLIEQAENFAKKNDGHVLSLGREPGKHLFPGVPEPLEDTMEFFEKVGFAGPIESSIDIIGDISNIDIDINPKLAEKLAANEADGFRVICYDPFLKEPLLSFMHESFPGKWSWTVKTFIESPDVALDEMQVLVQQQGEDMIVAGFASTATQASQDPAPPTIVQSQEDTTFGGLGPIGIGFDYRGSKGLGAMLLHYALVHLKEKGVTTVLIDWTSHGLLDRYYGPAGFKFYMNYCSLTKEFD